MAYGYHLEATYADGFTLVQDEADSNPFGSGNTFTAIRTMAPTPTHGAMTTFTLVDDSTADRYPIDWSSLSSLSPRPVYYRQMERTRNVVTGEDTGPMAVSHHFGYDYDDTDGNLVSVVNDYR